MKKIFVIIFFAYLLLPETKAQSRDSSRTIYNKDFKWTIVIPPGFDTVSAEVWAKMQKKGSDAIEKTYDKKVENNATTIFVFQNNQFNYFESNYQPFDTTTEGNYLESFNAVNRMVYRTFEAQMPGAKFDSVSSTVNISGLTFQTYNILITLPNKLVLQWHMYSRLFGSKEFTVNIMAIEKEKEKMMMDSWLSSKFEK